MLGFINNTNEEYHASPGVSSTALIKLIKGTPAHYRAYVDGNRGEQTAAMKFGSAVHSAILEPVIFAQNYIMKPKDMSFATKEGKAFRDQHTGKEFVSHDEMQKIKGMYGSIYSNSLTSELLSGGIAEQSYYNGDPDFLLKCRPDYLVGDVIVDIKTTESANAYNFQKSIANYGYNISACFYLYLLQKEGYKRFVHIAIEKEPPYAIAVYELDKGSLEKTAETMIEALRILKECYANNEWPGYVDRVQEVNMPAFSW